MGDCIVFRRLRDRFGRTTFAWMEDSRLQISVANRCPANRHLHRVVYYFRVIPAVATWRGRCPTCFSEPAILLSVGDFSDPYFAYWAGIRFAAFGAVVLARQIERRSVRPIVHADQHWFGGFACGVRLPLCGRVIRRDFPESVSARASSALPHAPTTRGERAGCSAPRAAPGRRPRRSQNRSRPTRTSAPAAIPRLRQAPTAPHR